MAGITQTIDNLNGGISEQPDDRKLPNQVNNILNGIPDPVEGLVKRPGAARVGTSKLANVQSSGKFFHYHRDETEGSYIGQVDNNGVTRMWKTSDGSACTMAHGVLLNAITNAGSGYTLPAPAVTISAPNVTGGVNATATSTLSTTGTVIGITITNHGSGYTSTPTITIAAPTSGTTATATAITTEDMTTQYLATTGTNNDAAGHSRSDSTGPTDNINVLTINDYSFISNRDITNPKTEPDIVDANYSAGWGDKTGDSTYDNEKEQYSCFIEILRTENGRQYGLNVYNSEDDTLAPRFSKFSNRNSAIDFTSTDGSSGEHPGTIVSVATRIKLLNTAGSNDLNEGNGTGACEGIGTQVFSAAETNNHNPAKTREQDADAPILSKWGVYNDINAGDKRPEYRHNLTFRITINGQQGMRSDADSGDDGFDGDDYRCTYARTVDLLHGGEGWVTGDTCLVRMTQCKEQSYQKIEVTDHEVVKHKANIMPARPVPTPFDTQVAVSVDGILGGIIDALNGQYNWGRNSPSNPPSWNRGSGGANTIQNDYPPNWNTSTQNSLGNDENGWYTATGNAMLKKQSSTTGQLNIKSGSDHINYKIIGNGIYLYCKSDFNVEVLHSDLMRVMHREVNSVADLPAQCRDGYVVRVLNFENSQDDDYYLKFQGENGRDGTGSWVECPRPQIRNAFDQSTFPMALVRDEGGSFTVKPWIWENRRVGDNVTNPKPTFLKTKSRSGTRINKCVFFRNRLGFLAGSSVILARPGTVDKPDFWANTALTISAIDPIDIASSSLYPSNLHDALEITAGLLCFSSNQQFLLTSDDTVLDPNTAKLKPVSSYNYSKKIPPVSLGTTFAFVDTSNKYSRLNEVIGVTRDTEPLINNASILVPTLIPKDVDLITNSRENNLIFIAQSYVDATSTPNADLIYGFKYLPPSTGQGDRKQAAWFKWRLSNPLKYHFVVNDEYFFIDTDDFLQKINFKQMASDPVIDDDQEGDFLVHLDNYISVTGGVYSSTTNKTTFSSQSWLGDVTQLIATHELVIVDTKTDSTSTRIGRYAICGDKTSSSFTVPGDWTETDANKLYVGYLYVYRVRLPKFYIKKQVGESNYDSNLNGYLTIQRVNLNFGKIGLYETELRYNTGKDTYIDVHESVQLDEYEVSDAPYLNEEIKTIPIYEKNTNVELVVKSEHPAPATLRSLSWEGAYSQKQHRRV